MLCSNHDYSKIINLPIFIVRDGDLSSSRQWERPPSPCLLYTSDAADELDGVDLDAEAGGGESFPLPAGRQVSISYDEDWKIGDFAVIMVAAQHLEAWKKLFSPNKIDQLPSLVELLELLDERRHPS